MFKLTARLKHRAFFVGGHTIRDAVTVGVLYLVYAIFGIEATLIAASTNSGFSKELGELSKAAKLAGGFDNTLKNNLVLARQAITDRWILAQWAAPGVILSLILGVSKWVFN